MDEQLDREGYIENIIGEDKPCLHYCSVCKAVVPIERMRVLLEQHDVEDTVSY